MSKIHGILAEFKDPGALLKAAEQVRDAGYKKFDCHSPFPIHGMDAAMGMKRTTLGYLIGFCATIGGLLGFGLQSWAHAVAYPIIYSGKTVFAWQAYAIITFALLVLFGAIGAVFGMLGYNRLPQWHHPVFYSTKFEKCSDDGFFISIEADDKKFEPIDTSKFLEKTGSFYQELLEEE